jgi:NAD(P)H-flavin reductase
MYHATIEHIKDTADKVRILRLKTAEKFTFKAGQYLTLHIEGYEPRSYSIASAPSQGVVEIHVKKSNDHGLSAYLHDAQNIGQSVSFSGPFGEMILSTAHEPIVAVALGVGITPFNAIITETLAQGNPNPITLYLGVHHADDFYLHDYFNSLGAKHPHFTLHLFHQNASDQSPYAIDSLQKKLIADCPEFQKNRARFYFCGAKDPITALATTVHAQGISKDKILSDIPLTFK